MTASSGFDVDPKHLSEMRSYGYRAGFWTNRPLTHVITSDNYGVEIGLQIREVCKRIISLILDSTEVI